MRNTRHTRSVHQSLALYTMDRKCGVAIFRLSYVAYYIINLYLFL
nr:unnamed protein product [Callosobruchus analis]